ncbi:MAG TPA: type II toxin-antitoxin system HicB family antitoxin [Firmicutes bacterium]|nr:type II toxin-antitoxin system HicB family antitoxin [Bacillota bacterium]
MVHEVASVLSRYIAAAMGEARYRILDDGNFFGEIPGLNGVWAAEPTLESCRQVLQEVLEEWLVLKLRDGDPIPAVGGVALKVESVAT